MVFFFFLSSALLPLAPLPSLIGRFHRRLHLETDVKRPVPVLGDGLEQDGNPVLRYRVFWCNRCAIRFQSRGVATPRGRDARVSVETWSRTASRPLRGGVATHPWGTVVAGDGVATHRLGADRALRSAGFLFVGADSRCSFLTAALDLHRAELGGGSRVFCRPFWVWTPVFTEFFSLSLSLSLSRVCWLSGVGKAGVDSTGRACRLVSWVVVSESKAFDWV